MKKSKAKMFCIKKWWTIFTNDGVDLSDEQAEKLGVALFQANCAYCEKYWSTSTKKLSICGKCPIRPKVKDYNSLSESGCTQKCHPFHKWLKEDISVETTTVMLDLIINS